MTEERLRRFSRTRCDGGGVVEDAARDNDGNNDVTAPLDDRDEPNTSDPC